MTPATPPRFRWPTPREIYDRLMGKIEPELTTANLPTLQATYAHESTADHTRRMQRYAKAMQAYGAAFRAWKNRVHTAFRSYRQCVLRSSERVSRHREELELRSLDHDFSE